MGLDMYLQRHKDWSSDTRLAYWRKANQIHKWFVDNVQGGTDDCGHYPVSKAEIKELLDIAITVNKAIEDSAVAEQLLPTVSGFFFGSTGYDEDYAEDIESTINQLSKIYNLLPDDAYPIYYHSSW